MNAFNVMTNIIQMEKDALSVQTNTVRSVIQRMENVRHVSMDIICLEVNVFHVQTTTRIVCYVHHNKNAQNVRTTTSLLTTHVQIVEIKTIVKFVHQQTTVVRNVTRIIIQKERTVFIAIHNIVQSVTERQEIVHHVLMDTICLMQNVIHAQTMERIARCVVRKNNAQFAKKEIIWKEDIVMIAI